MSWCHECQGSSGRAASCYSIQATVSTSSSARTLRHQIPLELAWPMPSTNSPPRIRCLRLRRYHRVDVSPSRTTAHGQRLGGEWIPFDPERGSASVFLEQYKMDHLFDQTHAGGELHIDRLLSHTTMLRTQWLEHSSLNTRFNLRPNCAGKTCATSSGIARRCCLPLSARQGQRKGRERGKAASRGIVPSLVGVHLSP